MPSKKNPKVDQYIKEAAPFAKPILNHLRKIVRASCPEAEETIKWDSPFYTYNHKIVCGMGTFKNHCKFWIKNWKSIVRDDGVKAKDAMEQMLHIHKVSEIPSATLLKSLLKQSMKLNEPGAQKVKRPPPRKKPPVKAPADLMLALRANPKALAAYKAFSTSNRRHYIDWIMDAKTEETREKRLEKAIDRISVGKTRHWLS